MASSPKPHYSGTCHQRQWHSTSKWEHFDSPLLYPAWHVDWDLESHITHTVSHCITHHVEFDKRRAWCGQHWVAVVTQWFCVGRSASVLLRHSCAAQCKSRKLNSMTLSLTSTQRQHDSVTHIYTTSIWQQQHNCDFSVQQTSKQYPTY